LQDVIDMVFDSDNLADKLQVHIASAFAAPQLPQSTCSACKGSLKVGKAIA